MTSNVKHFFNCVANTKAPFYSEEESAALALIEAVTKISDAGVPQELYEQVRKHFDEAQYVNLIMAISAAMVPGEYQPAGK